MDVLLRKSSLFLRNINDGMLLRSVQPQDYTETLTVFCWNIFFFLKAVFNSRIMREFSKVLV